MPNTTTGSLHVKLLPNALYLYHFRGYALYLKLLPPICSNPFNCRAYYLEHALIRLAGRRLPNIHPARQYNACRTARHLASAKAQECRILLSGTHACFPERVKRRKEWFTLRLQSRAQADHAISTSLSQGRVEKQKRGVTLNIYHTLSQKRSIYKNICPDCQLRRFSQLFAV